MSNSGVLGVGDNNCSDFSHFGYSLLDPFSLFTPSRSECEAYKKNKKTGVDDDKKNEMIKKISKIAPFVLLIIIIMMVF
jgi:hypothetical protein